jgi:hypothetical protein
MSDAEEKVQAAFLAKDITEYLLNENGFNLNGYTGVLPGNLRDIGDEDPACVREESFQKARKNIAKCCFYLKRRHGEEIEEMCQNLDIDDEQLHPNFEEVLASIWEEPRNWGRLASLFIAAYFICERLRKEGAEDKIDSVIGWLSVYLKRHAVPWVREHGGFVSEPRKLLACVVLWLTADFLSGMSARKEDSPYACVAACVGNGRSYVRSKPTHLAACTKLSELQPSTAFAQYSAAADDSQLVASGTITTISVFLFIITSWVDAWPLLQLVWLSML